MVEKEEIKIEKSTVLGWAIFIIIIVGLIFIVNKGYFSESEISDKEAQINKITETAGLYDSIQVGDLTFTLESIQLDFYNRIRFNLPSSYWLFFEFNVFNNGEDIETISECGVLQFEDSSQYSLRLSSDLSIDISKDCDYHEIYPGSQMKLTSYFTFIDQPYKILNFEGQKNWKEVPGSKIIYFSKQNNKLIMYSIDKSEIIYTED